MGLGRRLYPWFLCRLYDGQFQLAACCICRCHRGPICCLRDGKDPCRWRKGKGRYQSFYPQLDQLSYRHNSKWAILKICCCYDLKGIVISKLCLLLKKSKQIPLKIRKLFFIKHVHFSTHFIVNKDNCYAVCLSYVVLDTWG